MQASAKWIRPEKTMVLIIVLMALIALIPLYGILFPAVVDLPEHILVAKLLWEKITGTSHLDLTISWFLGYRLFPVLMLIVFSISNLFRIPAIYLPVIVTGTLIFIHVIVIVAILSSQLQTKSWKSICLTGCFILPAVAGMYSAAWFLGLVNYTLAISLLVAAVFLTEKFLRSGKWRDAVLLFVAVAGVYIAHPFALTFWLLWCACRLGASITTLSIRAEWRRIGLLAAVFLPIFLYHFMYHVAWTANNSKAAPRRLVAPFMSLQDWCSDRVYRLVSGYYLQVDYWHDSRIFCLFALAFIFVSTVLAFYPKQLADTRKLALTNLLFLYAGSGLNERFFPLPSGTWLAYDRRFSLVVYTLGLTVAATVLVRSLALGPNRFWLNLLLAFLAWAAATASLDHLLRVRKGYVRFDTPARSYMAKFLHNEEATGILLPGNSWHRDGTYVNHYLCLEKPDCISKGTFFETGYAADLFPVKLKRVASSETASKDQP